MFPLRSLSSGVTKLSVETKQDKTSTRYYIVYCLIKPGTELPVTFLMVVCRTVLTVFGLGVYKVV